MNVFITSDTFFGRELAAVEGGFENAEHMEESIVDNWNSKIKLNDIVYHLGNFGWDPISTESALAQLHGKIHFIGGSYDKHLTEISLIKVGRHILLPPIVEIPKLNLILSHWPLAEWANRENDSIHLHGGAKLDFMENRFCSNIKNWNWSPIDFDFIKEITKEKMSK